MVLVTLGYTGDHILNMSRTSFESGCLTRGRKIGGHKEFLVSNFSDLHRRVVERSGIRAERASHRDGSAGYSDLDIFRNRNGELFLESLWHS